MTHRKLSIPQSVHRYSPRCTRFFFSILVKSQAHSRLDAAKPVVLPLIIIFYLFVCLFLFIHLFIYLLQPLCHLFDWCTLSPIRVCNTQKQLKK